MTGLAYIASKERKESEIMVTAPVPCVCNLLHSRFASGSFTEFACGVLSIYLGKRTPFQE